MASKAELASLLLGGDSGHRDGLVVQYTVTFQTGGSFRHLAGFPTTPRDTHDEVSFGTTRRFSNRNRYRTTSSLEFDFSVSLLMNVQDPLAICEPRIPPPAHRPPPPPATFVYYPIILTPGSGPCSSFNDRWPLLCACEHSHGAVVACRAATYRSHISNKQ